MQRLEHPFAAYPMVEEAQATGRVAAVYADAAERLPFVPSILKSLALCPGYLVLAWEQMVPMVDEPTFTAAADAITASARADGRPSVSDEAADVLRPFQSPLSQMLLFAAGLHAGLSGRIAGVAASGVAPPAPEHPVAASAVSVFESTDLEDYGRLRAALDTPIVNTVWRTLSDSGQLRRSLPELEAAAERTRSHATWLQDIAYQAAAGLAWSPVASPESLDSAGLGDASPGMEAILDAYIKTLPRALVLVADL